MSLQGVLADFPVADVFQLIAQQRKTGVLEVERKGRTLEVHFTEGTVLRARPSETRPDGAIAGFLLRTGSVSEAALAEAWRKQEETLEPLSRVLDAEGLVSSDELLAISRLCSDETIFELFLWDDGNFRFRPDDVRPLEGEQAIGAEMVLLDALRMRDEWATAQGDLPDLAVIVTPCVDIEAFRARREQLQQSSGASAEQLEKVFTLANGRASARRIIDLSRLGTFQGARSLVALLRGDVVRTEKLVAATRESGLSAPSRIGGHLAVAYGVLLAASLVCAGLFALPGPRAATFPVPAEALAEAREEAALDRLRVALEAFRWARGAYPASLDQLEAGDFGLLAGVPLGRYSYQPLPRGYRLSRNQP